MRVAVDDAELRAPTDRAARRARATPGAGGGDDVLAGRRRSRRFVLLRRALVLVLFAAVVAGGTAVAFRSLAREAADVRHDLARSRRHLDSLGRELHDAGAARAAAEQLAAQTRDALARANTALTHVEQVRAGRSRELGAAQAALKRVQGTLAASLADEQKKDAELASLGSCLDGVSRALNYIGIGDAPNAAAALRGVDGDCRRAESGLQT